MTISPVVPSGTGCSAPSTTRAWPPLARPTEPILRCAEPSGLENEGATVSVRPMVSMTPMPNRCSKARRCSGGSADEAERQKRMACVLSRGGAAPSSR